MPLNYWKEGADDGTDTSDSIEPIENGEPIEQAYLNRAVENVRKRTEDVRTSSDSLELIERSDRVMTLVTQIDAYLLLTEPAAGEFRFYLNVAGTVGGGYDRDLSIVPLLTPSRLYSGVANNVAARFHYDVDGTNGLVVNVDTYSGAPRRVIHGAHNIYLQIINDAAISGTPTVEIKATSPGSPDPQDGPVYIIVKIEDGVTTLSQIDTAIDSSAAASLVTASVVGAGGTTVDTSGTPWGPYRAYETDAGDVGEGAQAGVDDEGFTIPASAFNTFFETNGERLKDGDTLFLDFDSAKTRIETTPATTLSAANLHIISADERAVTDARNLGDTHGPIPICKLVKVSTGPDVYNLIAANHRIFEKDKAAFFMSSYKCAEKAAGDLEADLADQAGTPNGDYMIGAEGKSATTGETFNLTTGTVNSQLLSIINQLADNVNAGATGDSVVGADAKTAAGGTGWALAQGSVSDQLQEIADELAANTGTPGASQVGAEALTSVPAGKSLTVGGVTGQLQELLNYHAGHTDTATGTDKHTYKNILGAPEFTAHPTADYGDSQTIDGLIDATDKYIALAGGPFTEEVNFDLDANYYIYNHFNFGNATWSAPAVGQSCAIFTSSAAGTVVFKDINFSGFSSAQTEPLISVDDVGTNDLTLIFDNCTFSNTNVGASKSLIRLQDSATGPRTSVIMRNCRMVGTWTNDTYTNDLIYVNTPRARIEITNCYFENFTRIVRYADITNFGWELKFTNNLIFKCGLTTASAQEALFSAANTARNVLFIISNNIWMSGEGGTHRGTLCKIGGRGAITGNMFYESVITEPSTADPFVYVEAGDETVVANNFFNHGNVPGVYLEKGTVIGNRIKVGGTGTTLVEADRVIGNLIDDSSTTVTNGIVCVECAIGNQLRFFQGTVGVLATDTNCRVSENEIDFATTPPTASIGVELESDTRRCVVANNAIEGPRTGIYVNGVADSNNAAMHVISGNVIKLDAAGSPVGIDVQIPYCMISNNMITTSDRNGSAIGIGIDLHANDHIALSGNMLLPSLSTDINSSGSGLGVGASGTPTLDHNWAGLAWLA